MSGWPESRLFTNAASLVPGARRGHLRARIRHSSGRDETAQLYSARRISLHDAKRLRLRLRQLSQNVASGQGTDWLGELEKETGGGASRMTVDGGSNRHQARLLNQQVWHVADSQSQVAVFLQYPRCEL